MPDLFFGRPVGHSRSFSLRPTYDNPSDYSRRFSIDPLGLISSLPNRGFVERIGKSNAQSRYEAVSYIESPTELTRRCFLAGCRGAGASFNLLQESGLVPFRCSRTVDPMGYRAGERRHGEVFLTGDSDMEGTICRIVIPVNSRSFPGSAI